MTTPFDGQTILIPDVPADEDPISNGGKWVYISGSALRRVNGYTTTQPGGALGEMLWNELTPADTSICWIFNNNPALGKLIGMKLRADITATTYYLGQFDTATANWALYKALGGAPIFLTDTGTIPTLEAGDRIGFAVLGTTLSMWYQQRASVGVPSPLPDNWTEIVSTTDPDIVGPGYSVLHLGGLEAELFGARGGGPVPAVGPTLRGHFRVT